MPVLALVAIALILWLTPGTGAAGARAAAPGFAAIDEHVEGRMRELRIPGLALAIVQGERMSRTS